MKQTRCSLDATAVRFRGSQAVEAFEHPAFRRPPGPKGDAMLLRIYVGLRFPDHIRKRSRFLSELPPTLCGSGTLVRNHWRYSQVRAGTARHSSGRSLRASHRCVDLPRRAHVRPGPCPLPKNQ